MNLNTIEANVDYISRRVPKIINNVIAALKTKKQIIHKFLKETNTNYEAFLKYKYEVSNRFNIGTSQSTYWRGNRDIHQYRFMLDPLSMLGACNAKEANELMEAYYSLDQLNVKDSIEDNNLALWKIQSNHYKDPFQKAFDVKSPTLRTINVCNMGISYEKNPVPRMLVKTLFRDDISNFMNSNKVENILNDCCIGVWREDGNNPINNEDELDKRKGYSEILLGQVSLHDVFDGILNCYVNAFMRTISNWENLKTPQEQNREKVRSQVVDFIKKYQAIFDIPDCQFIKDEGPYTDIDEKHFKEKIIKSMWMWKKELTKTLDNAEFKSVYKTLDDLNPYAIYLFMEFLFGGNSKVVELDDFGFQLKEKLENNLNEALESYINRSVISMIFTYGAKCGLENYINPLEINQEFVKSLMNETFEDVAALNEGLKIEFDDGKDQVDAQQSPDSIMSRRKIADLTRKRLFDYLMISFVAHNSSKKNYNLTNYFKKPSSNCFINEGSLFNKEYNGSNFYNFVCACLQEIHAHQSIISNFQTNIIGFKNSNYIYKDTYELGSQFIKKYINDLKIKENIQAILISTTQNYDMVDDGSKPVYNIDKLLKESCLIDPNSYNFNKIKNHRAFASLLKQLLKEILKLYYITGTYQEICKKEVLLKIPTFIRKNYIDTVSNISKLCLRIDRFLSDSSSWVGSEDKDILQTHIWDGNEWKNISILEKGYWCSNPHMTKYNSALIQQRIGYMWWNYCKYNIDELKESRDASYKKLNEICALYYSNNFEDVATTQEFFLDNDIERYLANFNTMNKNMSSSEPELFSINPSLVASREDLNSIESEVSRNNSYQFDYKKIVDKFKNYIDTKKHNELSVEELFTFSLLASSCEKSLNRAIASIESIQEFDKNNNEFEYLWIKSIDRYRLN